ncbi:hypothetical protein Tco_0174197 [Tanacetum coccineum]
MATLRVISKLRPFFLNVNMDYSYFKHYFGGDIPTEVVPDLQTFTMDNKFRGRVKHGDPKQSACVEAPLVFQGFPDCEDPLACCIPLSFNHSFILWESQYSKSNLFFGLPFYTFEPHFINDLGFTLGYTFETSEDDV